MTKATPKKKTTVKAHRGFAHVPLRGRRRPPIQRRPVGDPPRRRRRPPIQQPIGTPRRPMTPAQRDAMRRAQELARRRFNQERRRRQLEGTFTTTRGLGDRQPRQPKLPIARRLTVEQLRDARRIRRPVGDPKPRKRPTTPKQKQRVVQATQTPRTRRRRRPV